MDAKTLDTSKLPSRHVTEGPSRAPHRSYFHAMGLTEMQSHRPSVGVVSRWNDAAPRNVALMRQAQSAKKGVNAVVSRAVIANSIDRTMRGHCYGAVAGLAGCDKSLLGAMMSMLRRNVPAVFVYGICYADI